MMTSCAAKGPTIVPDIRTELPLGPPTEAVERLPDCTISGSKNEGEVRDRYTKCVVRRDIQLDQWRDWWFDVLKRYGPPVKVSYQHGDEFLGASAYLAASKIR